MNIKALGDRVIIKPDVVENKTKSGLLVTGDASREEMITGTVVSVGLGKEGTAVMPPEMKDGAKVMFLKYSASSIDVDGVEHYVVRTDELVAMFI